MVYLPPAGGWRVGPTGKPNTECYLVLKNMVVEINLSAKKRKKKLVLFCCTRVVIAAGRSESAAPFRASLVRMETERIKLKQGQIRHNL